MKLIDMQVIQRVGTDPGIDLSKETPLTEQHHIETCDMRTIMRKAQKTGVLEHVSQYQGQYMNLAGRQDLLHYQLEVQKSREMFATIPATIRARFNNDPGDFLDWICDEKNRNEIQELGFKTDHLPPVQPPAAPAAASVAANTTVSATSSTTAAAADPGSVTP